MSAGFFLSSSSNCPVANNTANRGSFFSISA
ncbi:MAG: hypothetical protein F6K36_29305 [Symploca sp. SIO3C6]|uniref:Uncharacterized protein n=1 Tax=Symploca sp. SIO1C4 TaxID=2607765 RepID=A0A6B3NCF4_9CYAN|nr:hypothetical protein [Symploca sp. SIO3C6]NEO98683.1 hypothetical protein [Symploca sp. SIO2E9]NER29233.1 hypothetical protein [Symploca sp. SIO1C4]